MLAAWRLDPRGAPAWSAAWSKAEEGEDRLKYERAFHCALDAVPEACRQGNGVPPPAAPATGGLPAVPPPPPPPPAGYLGVLYAAAEDGTCVYGYATATGVTLMLCVEGDDDVRENDVRAAFEGFHQAYADAVANPFHTFGQPIVSQAFTGRVKAACRAVR